MRIVSEPGELPEAIGNLQYPACGFVPTMGALHEGHLALIRRAAELARPVVVSIFVNPTQFGPDEDYERYPRTFDADIALAEKAGADVIFAPTVEAIYPGGAKAPIHDLPELPGVARLPGAGLEEAHRPGHFAGVCQVVSRLFDLARPSIAVFGEKDYQQLLVIERMVEQERPRWGELRIVRHPTVREADGLAMSSRNRFLSPAQRERALGIFRALESAQGATDPRSAERLMHETLAAHDLTIDYAVVRDAATLLPIDSYERPARALIAARVDEIRLIDNRSMTT